MTCKCGSEKIISFGGKCDDRSSTSCGSNETYGYVPYSLGIGGGDYVEFDFCGDCGLIQGFTPIPQSYIDARFREE